MAFILIGEMLFETEYQNKIDLLLNIGFSLLSGNGRYIIYE